MQHRNPTPALLAAAALAALASPAQAVVGVYDKYFVTTEASSGAPGGYSSTSWYNQRSSSINALPGAVTAGRGTFSTAGSSTDTTGRLTAAASVADTFGAGYDAGGSIVADGSFSKARAAADLATASLRVSVDNDVGNGGFVQGAGYAEWHDILHFTVAGATAATVTRLTVELNIEGSWRDTGERDIYGNRPQGSLAASFYLDNPNSAAGTLFAANGWTWQAVPGGVPTMSGANDGGWGNWVLSTPEAMRFIGSVDIVGSTAVLNPTFRLGLDCALGSVCDYGHTATMRFVDLAPGVSFTSDSSVFLTAAVPEPQSWALLLGGLGVLGTLARRRAGR